MMGRLRSVVEGMMTVPGRDDDSGGRDDGQCMKKGMNEIRV
jgi:hypothetical protein